MVDITLSRAHLLGAPRSQLKKDIVEPIISLAKPLPYYMVSIKIGTPGVLFYLMVDTGSHITWVQAHGCANCFDVKNGSFNFRDSNSFKFITCGNPFCGKCNEFNLCDYIEHYGENIHSKTEGFLARDDMTFLSDVGGQEKVNMVFGVGLNNRMMLGRDNQMVGIFGLGPGKLSFVSQIPTAWRRFSYCLPKSGDVSSNIKFGKNVEVPNDINVKTTPLGLSHWYMLDCIGMSVNGIDIGLPNGVFKDYDSTSRFIIDIGAPQTALEPNAYIHLTNVLIDYFKQFRVRRLLTTGDSPFQSLCYQSWKFYLFPDITFHFQDANFTLKPEAAFDIGEDSFCLAMSSSEKIE
ncbi:Aspartyl protease family protein [Thalictrum thalictroides]|uniref:Aspartyl protease family protein n=1 Tax=Thalictrum thalictroides TaxID=46969 RepID=A0A7J6WN29_THATH|nr:Aspartyl protease family protein [Thalictrum thalictroides]